MSVKRITGLDMAVAGVPRPRACYVALTEVKGSNKQKEFRHCGWLSVDYWLTVLIPGDFFMPC